MDRRIQKGRWRPREEPIAKAEEVAGSMEAPTGAQGRLKMDMYDGGEAEDRILRTTSPASEEDTFNEQSDVEIVEAHYGDPVSATRMDVKSGKVLGQETIFLRPRRSPLAPGRTRGEANAQRLGGTPVPPRSTSLPARYAQARPPGQVFLQEHVRNTSEGVERVAGGPAELSATGLDSTRTMLEFCLLPIEEQLAIAAEGLDAVPYPAEPLRSQRPASQSPTPVATQPASAGLFARVRRMLPSSRASRHVPEQGPNRDRGQ